MRKEIHKKKVGELLHWIAEIEINLDIKKIENKKLEEENKKLREEKEMLKQCLDKLMFDADVVNVKINGDVGDYVYVRSDKQFKLNIKD